MCLYYGVRQPLKYTLDLLTRDTFRNFTVGKHFTFFLDRNLLSWLPKIQTEKLQHSFSLVYLNCNNRNLISLFFYKGYGYVIKMNEIKSVVPVPV